MKKETCVYSCGRVWDEKGDVKGFSDCVSAYHKMIMKTLEERWLDHWRKSECDVAIYHKRSLAFIKSEISKALDSVAPETSEDGYAIVRPEDMIEGIDQVGMTTGLGKARDEVLNKIKLIKDSL